MGHAHDSSPIVFIQERYSAGRDGYQERERKVRWVGHSLLLDLARCRVLREDDWGWVRDMLTKCCFLQIETHMLSKTITPEILTMPQSRNCNELLGTFSECLPFFYDNHNQNIFCCGASVASEQQHNQDLRRIYRRGYEFSNSSLFTRMHCS